MHRRRRRMLNRLREAMFGVGRRVSAVGSGFVDTFLRDNRVIPIVLALLALLVFAWIVAGAFLGGPAKEPVSNRAEVAQAQNPQPPIRRPRGREPRRRHLRRLPVQRPIPPARGAGRVDYYDDDSDNHAGRHQRRSGGGAVAEQVEEQVAEPVAERWGRLGHRRRRPER